MKTRLLSWSSWRTIEQIIRLIIIELKNGKSPEEAIQQIVDRDYPGRFDHYKGNIIAVGINYDGSLENTSKDYKKHSCLIRKF